jgi:hypothetical protein
MKTVKKVSSIANAIDCPGIYWGSPECLASVSKGICPKKCKQKSDFGLYYCQKNSNR